MERIAEKEVGRIAAKHQRYQERQGYVSRWVERLEHRVQMMLGIFSAKGVLPVEFKPAHSVGDLLTQHLDELEQGPRAKVASCSFSSTTSRRYTKSIRRLLLNAAYEYSR